MGTSLDLATVLFLLKTCYLAGGAALAYVRWHSVEGIGAGAMAVGFILQAVGSTLAGVAEVDHPHYAALSLINLTVGVLAVTTLFVGASELSGRRRDPSLAFAHLVPLVVLLVGLATRLHVDDVARATLFNLMVGTAHLALAVRFVVDGRAEPLPARRFLVLAFGAAGLTSLLVAGEFATGWFGALPPVTGFVVVITFKLMIALFAVILVMERINQKLDRLARTDALTGVGNRRSFYEASPARPPAGDAVILFDADRFKRLNDQWGHDFGDEVLRKVAASLAACVRSNDVLARYGGEEFILYLPGMNAALATAIAERARAAVADLVLHCGSERVRTSVSAGIAVSAGAGGDLRALIRQADEALYAAKKEGGNRTRLFSPEPAVAPIVVPSIEVPEPKGASA